MSDEPVAPVIHEGMSKAEAKEMLDNHKKEIQLMFEEHKQHLTEQMSGLTAGDKEEKEQLKADLKNLQDWRDEQIKAIEAREKSKGDETTIVTPPANIPPPPDPNPTSGQTSGSNDEPKRKRGFASWF